MKKRNRSKKLYKPHNFAKIYKKPLHLFGWFIIFILSTYFPVYIAQLYENSIYSMSGTFTKIEAAHYTNMIAWAYNVSALVTVVLCYLIARRMLKIFKDEV